jgi:Dolichyl-phosphate-mannose-protein mannosyltransferase
VSVVPVTRPGLVSRWHSFESWVGTRRSAAALFVLALAVFAVQSVALPVQPGRDMPRYVQTYLQFFEAEPILPSVLNSRGPLTALGVSLPLELGGAAAEIWLGLLYAASILAWGYVALSFGARTALLTTALLLAFPGYGIMFHGLASDAIFAAAFAGWAVLLTRALLKPSVAAFLFTGVGMGALVLVRPANQALVVLALLPLLLLRGSRWERRLTWAASLFVSFSAVTQGWKALAALRWGDAVALKPSTAVLATSLVLCVFFVPSVWRRRLGLLAIPLVAVVVAVNWSSVQNPVHYVRTVAQGPPVDIFLFRAFEVDRIVAPENGPASRQLAEVVQRDLLAEEPYRSYGVDLDEFFSSGSDRMFVDLASLGDADLQAVTEEAIREHPGAFAEGIAGTVWEMLWHSRVYGPESAAATTELRGGQDLGVVEVGDRNLPRPSEGELIPSSRVGPAIRGLRGGVREVWHSPTGHNLVFDHPSDERRYLEFERDTYELVGRIPTRDAMLGAVHRLNQASYRFPPPFVWLAIGAVALAVRRPRGVLAALAPSLAGLVVVAVTGAVTLAVGEYVVPVAPAFVLLAAAGLLGAHPRGRLPIRRSRATT